MILSLKKEVGRGAAMRSRWPTQSKLEPRIFSWIFNDFRRIFFIIGMEACERFSYYGMRAILTIYLIYLLKVQV